MWIEVINMLKLLAFASSYPPNITHNALVLMIDPWFKNLYFIQHYVGFNMAMNIVVV
jgi:hypothetical protein